jgi:hypothetical protein
MGMAFPLEGARVPRCPPPRTRRLAFAPPHVNACRPTLASSAAKTNRFQQDAVEFPSAALQRDASTRQKLPVMGTEHWQSTFQSLVHL